jgi:diacylglycerol kinase (ATP)
MASPCHDGAMPRPLRVVVAVNRSASFGKRADTGDMVVERLRGVGHVVDELVRPTFAELLSASHEAVATKPDAFVVVGGDGMVNLGANVLATTSVPLGIVPAGTGNDMARALRIPHDDSVAAVNVLIDALDAPPLEIDAGLLRFTDEKTGEPRERWFACMVSAGFDALVNERANRMRFPKGASRYILAMLLELVGLKPIRYALTIDGVRKDVEANLVSVGNGVSLGGGMRVTPDAMLDDGLFDVMTVEPLGRIGFLRLFPRVFAGTHVSDPRVHVSRGERIRIDSPGITAYADGERVAPLPLEIEVVPGALRVLAPEPVYASQIASVDHAK